MLRRDILSSALALPLLGAGASAPPAPAMEPRPRGPRVVRAGDGARLFHRDWGEGPAVVFAASWALSSEMWAYQVAHLSDAGLRCIAYDRRGHGRSDAPAGGYDMDTLADDLAAMLDQLGLDDVTLVGHSMGCAEIIRYLARHGSRRVRRVALLAPAAPCLVQTAANPYGAPGAYFDARMAAWAKDFPRWAVDNKAPFFTPETSPDMTGWLMEQLVATPVPVAIASFKALIAADLRPDLARIDRPTLILQGTKDVSTPLEITGRRIAAGVKGAELKVYDGAPHGLFVTHMSQVNRDLAAFVRA